MQSEYYISLGSNLADNAKEKSALLSLALKLLDSKGAAVVRRSKFYSTPAFPNGSGPDFINAAAVVESALEPEKFLAILHEVEAELGRTRHQRWAARSCDIDLLAHGQDVLPDPGTVNSWIDLPLSRQMQEAPDRLILPHPRIQDRAFVLVPLNDVAPGWRHPLLGLSVVEMLAALPKADREEIREIKENWEG